MLCRIIFGVILFISLTACGSQRNDSKPLVAIISPPQGSSFLPGEVVIVRLSVVASTEIKRVELRNGSVILAAQGNPNHGTTYSALISFVPTQAGTQTLSALAYDTNDIASDPATLTIMISTSETVFHLATPASLPPTVTSLTDCQLASTFLADVTIPDGTSIVAGTHLTKTWRMRNTSLCAWTAGFTLAFMEGEHMSAPLSVMVQPTAQNAEVDIHVPIVAPLVSGTYTNTWRMRTPDGTAFGNRLYTIIRVP